MSYGDALTEVVPVVGAAGTGYATSINETIEEMQTVLESKVPFSALQGDELDMQNVPIIDATYVSLVEGVVTPAASPIGRLARYQNNLYWVTDEGAVRITLNGTLDATSVAGIGGDYGGLNPALVSFSDANLRYEFYDDFGSGAWAYLRARGLDIAAGATSSNMARLRYGGAGSYDWTFPATLPASNRSLLVISSAGQVEDNDATNTISNNVYLSTATIYHTSERKLNLTLRADYAGTPASITHNVVGFEHTVITTTGSYLNGLQSGWRIKSVAVKIQKQTTGSTSLELFKSSYANSVSQATASSTTSGDSTVTLTLGSPYTVTDADGFYIAIVPAANLDQVFGACITYDYPAP